MTSGGVPVPLGPPKQRAVLAMLVIDRNRPVSVESLIEGVWEGDPVPAARAGIQAHVSNLRRLVRSAGADPARVLPSVPPGYQLCVDDADCDVGRFLAARAQGAQAAAEGRFDEASQHFSIALAQWRGPVLDDLHDFSFAAAYAATLIEEKVATQLARAEAEIACGRAAAVIGELETLAAEHLYREPVWAQLITAYYVTERQSDALGAYRRLKTALADGLGIDPGPTVTALHERILRQEPLGTKLAVVNTRKRDVAQRDDTIPDRQAGARSVARLRDKTGREYRLSGATLRIGRFTDNDIVLDDVDVSRHHAVIADTGTAFVITDLQSTNGVQVRGRRIRGSTALADGDRIGIGNQEFSFEICTG